MNVDQARKFLNKCVRAERVDYEEDQVEVRWKSVDGGDIGIGYFGINTEEGEVLMMFLGQDYIFKHVEAINLYRCGRSEWKTV